MTDDMPQFASSTLADTRVGSVVFGENTGMSGTWDEALRRVQIKKTLIPEKAGYGTMTTADWFDEQAPVAEAAAVVIHKDEEEDMPAKRLVKVIIVDPDEDVPVENSVLHIGSEMMTDLTDQELFFELPIKDLLEEHNAKRSDIKVKGKKKKKGDDDEQEYLEPIKIRDLVMHVLTIASFNTK